ncbi:MAG: hypothetical protein DIU68_009790 [Chloroflexota bacterium]|nr:MAG: hypothetical protein DIU68_13900 [Chloroflexota bacterium]
MAIHLDWDDEHKRLILVRVDGRWTWGELERSLENAISMMDSVSHKVNFIIDIRNGQMDLGSALGQIQKAATPETHRNEGMKVVVGANRMIRSLYGAYRALIQSMGKDQEFHFADTIDEARAMIDSAGL